VSFLSSLQASTANQPHRARGRLSVGSLVIGPRGSWCPDSVPIAWTVGLDALPPAAAPPVEAKEPLSSQNRTSSIQTNAPRAQRKSGDD
jgi:hypothetical protein